MKEAAIAIDGFGNVGFSFAKYLDEFGARIVAVSDSEGSIYNPDGLDYERLVGVKKETGSVVNFKGGQILASEELYELPVEMLVPASIPDVINERKASMQF